MRTTTPPIVVLRTRYPLPAPRPRAPRPQRCAYCHASLGEGSFDCVGCKTRVHGECKRLLGTCPTLGCTEVWTHEPSPPRGLDCARCRQGFRAYVGARRRVCVLCGMQYHWRCRYRMARCHCGSSEFRSIQSPRPEWASPRVRRFFKRVFQFSWIAAMLAIVGFVFTTQLEASAPRYEIEISASQDDGHQATVRVDLDRWDVKKLNIAELIRVLDESDNTERRVLASRELEVRGAAAVPRLVRHLELTGDLSASHLLVKVGAPAVPALRESLVQRGVLSSAFVLEEIGEPAVPAFIHGLKYGDASVRMTCISSLENLGRHAKLALPDLRRIGANALTRHEREAAREAQFHIEDKAWGTIDEEY